MTRRERRRALALLRSGRSIRCASVEEAQALVAGAAPGALLHLVALHGPACSPLACRCAPEYLLEQLTAENYRTALEAEARWRAQSVS